MLSTGNKIMLIGYSKEREEEFRQYWDKEIEIKENGLEG